MIKSKKQMFLVIGAFLLVMFLGTITYAFFNYTRTGTRNLIKVGRISFESKNEETITLNNLFPIDPESSSEINDSTKIGTYSIDIKGDTDYVNGIEYLVSVVDSNIGSLPISLDFTITGLGTPNDNYYVSREAKNANIYKKLAGRTLVGDQMILVGYIKPNTTNGQSLGVDGNITIKAYLDKDKILISDTYDGIESDNMGTTNNQAAGKTVITTTEWNSLQTNGVSFKVKVEANEGIWVTGSLEEIMRKSAVMDNINSDYVNNTTPGIDFDQPSSDTNGKGVYMRAGTENDPYPIMYYRGEVENNNIIFADKCWKAVRTTDAGGVKLIYSGLPGSVYEQGLLDEEKYSLNTTNTDSRWTFDSSDNTWNIEINDNSHPAIEFTVPQGNNYSLSMAGTSGSDCGGGFFLYKNGTSLNSYGIGGGSDIDYSYYFETLTNTDIIKMNYMGSSSSTCAITFKIKMSADSEKIADNGCNNKRNKIGITQEIDGEERDYFSIVEDYYDEENDYFSYATGYMYGGRLVADYYWNGINLNHIFGRGFTWDGANYTLTDTVSTSYDINRHYICSFDNDDTTCQSVLYIDMITLMDNDIIFAYVKLADGDNIEDVLSKMKTNEQDSDAKKVIEEWYANNLANYTNRIEDTVYCNNRNIGRYNGFSSTAEIPVTGKTYYDYSSGLAFESMVNYYDGFHNNINLMCSNKNDRFTVNNEYGNKLLNYPIALITMEETILAGACDSSDNSFYLNSGASYLTMTPSSFLFYNLSEYSISDSGKLKSTSSTSLLRPTISIKPGQLITKGTGTASDPYIIE